MSGKLNQANSIWDPGAALTVVMTACSYSMNYEKEHIIEVLDRPLISNVKIFHAGTRKNHNSIVTDGGRVLSVTASGISLCDAQQKAYHVVDQIGTILVTARPIT